MSFYHALRISYKAVMKQMTIEFEILICKSEFSLNSATLKYQMGKFLRADLGGKMEGDF